MLFLTCSIKYSSIVWPPPSPLPVPYIGTLIAARHLSLCAGCLLLEDCRRRRRMFMDKHIPRITSDPSLQGLFFQVLKTLFAPKDLSVWMCRWLSKHDNRIITTLQIQFGGGGWGGFCTKCNEVSGCVKDEETMKQGDEEGLSYRNWESHLDYGLVTHDTV